MDPPTVTPESSETTEVPASAPEVSSDAVKIDPSLGKTVPEYAGSTIKCNCRR